MARYTTGEAAKLCGVSVRTVQYYDTRGILVPSALTDGGRRIYSEEDLQRLRIICFLRELDMSIDNIKDLFSEEQPEDIILMLLNRQEKVLRSEIAEKEKKADTIAQTKKALRHMSELSVDSIGDAANIIKSKEGLSRIHRTMLIIGIPLDIAEAASIIYWIISGIWHPFALTMLLMAVFGVALTKIYFGKVSYICPKCHRIFRPSLKESFFANHTPYTRKLKCPHCSYHGLCLEIYKQEVNENE